MFDTDESENVFSLYLLLLLLLLVIVAVLFMVLMMDNNRFLSVIEKVKVLYSVSLYFYFIHEERYESSYKARRR